MEFREGAIHDVVVRDLNRHEDHRGWLIECFRQDEIDPALCPVMSYVSMTLPGVARGPHEHLHQSDQFCFLGPSTFRVCLWDHRADSPTRGIRQTVSAGEGSPRVVIVPPRVVHAYQNVGSVEGWVINYPNRLYAGWKRGEPVDEIRHEDVPDSPFRI